MARQLYVVYKTHLDIGFTDLAENVMEQYVTDYIPRALEIGEQVPDKFVWTTGSWLIHHYLTNPEIAETAKERLRAGIRGGWIKWHGLPVTTHTELMDQRLFDYGLSLSQQLDQEFQQQTVGAKMTDVPGHTISMVPLMAKAGLKYLHIGVNASSAIPDVPELFVWRAKDGSELVVHYAQDYGETFSREGWDQMLYFAHSHDNAGPPADFQEVEDLFEKLSQEYPGVELIPASLDEFAQIAWDHRQELPVIEEEIGDSWIHGIASDPKKVADYLALLRLRDEWLVSGQLNVESQEYQAFSEQLMLVAEHTWGGNGNVFLPDYRNYQLADFQAARARDVVSFNHDRRTMDFADLYASINTDINSQEMKDKRSYRLYEASWQEQRNYLTKAIAVLEPSRQATAKAVLVPQALPTFNQNSLVTPGIAYQIGKLILTFGTNGSITGLEIGSRSLIGKGREFGGLSYERFDFADYQQFMSQYCRLTQQTASWALVDFAKRGIEAHGNIRHERLRPTVKNSQLKETSSGAVVDFDLSFSQEEQRLWGLPSKVTLSYDIDGEKGQIDGQLIWQGKQSNRMPEGYWLETSIQVGTPTRWQMAKMNGLVSPDNVLVNGNRKMHALTKEGLSYQGHDGSVNIRSLDAPLFSFGGRQLLNFDNRLPNLNDGIYLNLFNNTWGTNFPAWFEDDMCYRFSLSLG